MDKHAPLRQHLIDLLKGGNAHASFEDGVRDFPPELRGKRPTGAPHSPWEELEHLRITQWDILEFSRDPDHKSPKWPDDYWPKNPEPPDNRAWDRSVRAFTQELDSMCALIADDETDLYASIPQGEGRPYCVKRCWSPITTPTIWASSYCSGAFWGPGEAARKDSTRRANSDCRSGPAARTAWPRLLDDLLVTSSRVSRPR